MIPLDSYRVKRELRHPLPGLRAGAKRRDNGFGDGLAAAFELVMTPAIFGVLGYLLDRALGLVPVFTLIFSLSVVLYELWKLWSGYMAESDVELQRWRDVRDQVGRSRG